METNERKEIYRRDSIFQGHATTFRVLVGPGTRPYSPHIMNLDRIIYIELESNEMRIEFPFSIRDQEQLWEAVFDVWVLPQKKINYAKRFSQLINNKLLQAKLPTLAKPYWVSQEKQTAIEA